MAEDRYPDEFPHVSYWEHPHYACEADQWGEYGYLLYEGKVYHYHEDRKEQLGWTDSPRSIEDFLAFIRKKRIKISPEFRALLKEELGNDGRKGRGKDTKTK